MTPSSLQALQAGTKLEGKHKSKAGSWSSFEEAALGSGLNYKHHAFKSELQGRFREPWASRDSRRSCNHGNQGGLPRRGGKGAEAGETVFIESKGFDRSAQQKEAAVSLLTLRLH